MTPSSLALIYALPFVFGAIEDSAVISTSPRSSIKKCSSCFFNSNDSRSLPLQTCAYDFCLIPISTSR